MVPFAHGWVNEKICTDDVGFLVTARFPEIDRSQVLILLHLADRAEGTIGLRGGHGACDLAAWILSAILEVVSHCASYANEL